MNDAERTALIAAAKRIAVPVASCVAGGVRPDHLLAGKSWDELAALLTVAMETVDHFKLNALVQLPGDEGLSPAALHDAALRRAHAEVRRLRLAGEPIPMRLRLLEHQYQEAHPRPAKQEGTAA